MTTQPEIDHALLLASATKDCHHDKEQAWDVPGVAERCQDCHGTGRVYLLGDAARIPCWEDYDYHFPGATCEEGNIRPDCLSCEGRGWTSTTDGDVMAQAVWPLLERTTRHLSNTAFRDYLYARGRGDPIAIWGAAVWKVLLAAGLVKETP